MPACFITPQSSLILKQPVLGSPAFSWYTRRTAEAAGVEKRLLLLPHRAIHSYRHDEAETHALLPSGANGAARVLRLLHRQFWIRYWASLAARATKANVARWALLGESKCRRQEEVTADDGQNNSKSGRKAEAVRCFVQHLPSASAHHRTPLCSCWSWQCSCAHSWSKVGQDGCGGWPPQHDCLPTSQSVPGKEERQGTAARHELAAMDAFAVL